MSALQIENERYRLTIFFGDKVTIVMLGIFNLTSPSPLRWIQSQLNQLITGLCLRTNMLPSGPFCPSFATVTLQITNQHLSVTVVCHYPVLLPGRK